MDYINFRPNLYVSNMDKALIFYRDVIGLDVLHADDSFALLGRQGAELALVSKQTRIPQQAYLYVSDVETLYVHCQSQQAVITMPLTTHEYGTRDFVVQDEDGNLIGVGQRIDNDSLA